MANDVTIKGVKAPKGSKLTKGTGWRLVTTKGQKRVFNGTLLQTIIVGGKRLAIFSVPT
jgi:hypothetical protein